MNESPVHIDALLTPLLHETSDAQADEILSHLITTHAEPVIKNVIRFKLRLSSYRESQRAEADDIHQEAVLQLVTQLQRFRQAPDGNPIGDMRGMAAVIAHRTCARWMRRQFPERHAVKNRLHYLLTRQPGFSLWQDSDNKLLAGFAAWQERHGSARHGSARRESARHESAQPLTTIRTIAEVEKLPAHIRSLKLGKSQELAEAIAAILNYAGGPVEFEDLVSTIAALQGISDQPIESLSDNDDAAARVLATGEADPAWRTEKRMFLQRLWEELQQLPKNQRAALLLNLRDGSGNGCITLFPATGIATLRELAAALEITAETFAEIWNDLPLEDARIAELLALTRQQVINARKSGRERLARRLKGFI